MVTIKNGYHYQYLYMNKAQYIDQVMKYRKLFKYDTLPVEYVSNLSVVSLKSYYKDMKYRAIRLGLLTKSAKILYGIK